MLEHPTAAVLLRLASGELADPERPAALRHLTNCPACREALLRELRSAGPGDRAIAEGNRDSSESSLMDVLIRRAAMLADQMSPLEGTDEPDDAIERIPLEFIDVEDELAPLALAAAPAAAAEEVAPARQTKDGRLVIRFRRDPVSGLPQGVVIAERSETGEGAALVFPQQNRAFPVEPDGTISLEGDLGVVLQVCGEFWRFPLRA